ncbi:MAG: methyltransferase domain-containing protein [Chloroflexia bacterium]
MEFEEFRIMYEAEDRHWWYRGLRGVMFSLLGLKDPRSTSWRILDAGCGTGGNLEALRSAGFAHSEGFDVNPPALHFCGMRGLTNVQLGSIMEIPYQADSFDAVISCDVLNDAGTSNEAGALVELYRVLKPGGRLFLNLPAFSFLRGEHDRATSVARRYTKPEIKGKLRKAGFRVRRVTYWNMFLLPVVMAVRLVRRDGEDDRDRPARSDIVVPPEPLNALLTGVVGLERLLLRFVDFPAGSSVAAVAVKPRGERAREHGVGP